MTTETVSGTLVFVVIVEYEDCELGVGVRTTVAGTNELAARYHARPKVWGVHLVVLRLDDDGRGHAYREWLPDNPLSEDADWLREMEAGDE
ncbi:MAG: hypothetical protein A2004_04670 [Spirochaetes bacterium GWC1_61_12]|nr:MAG: hypothetical protein A2004_04670 [Spirochaetes bacterium GWC1_61_12]